MKRKRDKLILFDEVTVSYLAKRSLLKDKDYRTVLRTQIRGDKMWVTTHFVDGLKVKVT